MEKDENYRTGYQVGYEVGRKKASADLEPVLVELRNHTEQLKRIADIFEAFAQHYHI